MECLDDNQIAAFVEGGLAADERRRFEAHVDACAACRRLVAGLGRLLEPETAPGGAGARPDPGQVVGRYVVLRRLGAGGMGVVYLAYDPTLDRKIALKLLRAQDGDDDGRAGERLLREARAMARLAHPNIAAVHDAGAIDGQPFIAMELLEGGTLTEHLSVPRRLREVLAAFTAAGRGLSAAHRAGLVHRDFKPDNVLFGADGRVCVSDFGLVAAGAEPGAPAAATGLTQRTRGGTPGYMAPEQQLGQVTDARGDQYSFCVALHRALYGEGPFAGDGAEERLAAALADRVRPPAARARVPARVRQAILRGLYADPEQRWPSMDALLRALGDEPLGKGRLALAAVVVAAIVGLGVVRAARPAAAVCRDEAGALGGAWDAARRSKVERALLATGQPFAKETWARVAPALDGYASAWAAMAAESCQATRVRGDQPDGIFSLRAVCLAQRREELRALVDLLENADRGVVESAVSAAAALTPIASCGDVAALGARVRPPTDPALRREVDAARADLIRAKALGDTGKYADGEALAREIVARARKAGYRPVLAEALLRQALLETAQTRHRDAEATMLDALFNAEASGHDAVAAEGWAQLVHITLWEPEIARAASYQPRAEAAIARIGGDAHLSDVLEGGRGFVLFAQGHVAEAAAVLRALLEAQERRLGPDSPALGDTLDQLAYPEAALGHDAEVLALRERSRSLSERELGPDHPGTALADVALGEALLAVGELDRAEGTLRRAITVEEATGKEKMTAGALVALGQVRDRQGHVDEGLALIHRGLAMRLDGYGPVHPATALAEGALADTLLRHDRFGDAREAATKALRTWTLITPGQFMTAAAGTLLGRAELGLGALDRAAAALEPAVQYYAQAPGTPAAAFSARMALARVLWDHGGDRARARRLVEAALAIPPGPSPDAARERDAARAWLDAHRPG